MERKLKVITKINRSQKTKQEIITQTNKNRKIYKLTNVYKNKQKSHLHVYITQIKPIEKPRQSALRILQQGQMNFQKKITKEIDNYMM